MKRLEFPGIPAAEGEGFYAVTASAVPPGGNYYFLSNDILTLELDRNRQREDVVLCGVANPHFFHVVSLVSRVADIKRVIAVDYNYDQLLHFDRILKLILSSGNRMEFLQRLFKVTFNAKAIHLLNQVPPAKANVVRGGVEKDHLFALEQEVWRNLRFDAESFTAAYGLDAVAGTAGLLVKSETVGDINTYFATFFCGSRSDYEHWPFSAGFGSGFLRDEEAFSRTQRVLRETQWYLLHGDLADLYPDLLNSNRYSPVVVWCSNLLCDYFIEKHPKLNEIADLSARLGTQSEPSFPEMDLVLLQDERTRNVLPSAIDNVRRRRRRWSVHTRSFAVVSRHLRGSNNLEVIGERRWYEQDGGISKLPNTTYCMMEDFRQAGGTGRRYDSILLHILSGHCASKDEYGQLLVQARTMTDNLIVLEHNRLSRDFSRLGCGMTLDEMRDLLGAESVLEYAPGERCADRNLVLVYRN